MKKNEVLYHFEIFFLITIVTINAIVSFIEKLKGSLDSDDEDINNGENTLYGG